jgi:type IV secretory pathway VirD2 relaxase
MSDDDFEPKLGRIGSKDRKRTLKHGARIVLAARLAGKHSGIRSRRFDGSRIGRGASMGRLLSSRDRLAQFRGRRAVVKTRLVRLGAKGIGSAKAHLRYIQRDGVTREGDPGALYSADRDQADGSAFLERSIGDRHQFRLIVSVEDGAEYPDLKPYIRRLMTQVEEDLATRLDWVAVDHFNTERPHSHIMLRGVDDRGQNLIIAREYIAHGFRERAAELVTLDLGPRTDREIEQRLRHDVGEERLTAIDRRLLRRMDAERIVTAGDRDPFQQSIMTGRLHKLEGLGLADDQGAGRYRLADGLDETLRRMGERGDVIRLMQRELTRRRLEKAGADQVIADEDAGPIVGRVVHQGLVDEHRDRRFMLVDAVDGRVHYVETGNGNSDDGPSEGAIVRVTMRSAQAREVDRTIAEVAAAHGGRYSVDLHRQHDPASSKAFVETHVRRLEALRRAGVGGERDADGSWTIAADHVERVAAYEQRRLRDHPVDVELLSSRPIEQLGRLNAATWLDRELIADSSLAIRDAGFGREVRSTLTIRRHWLIEQELADGDAAYVKLRANALTILQRRELLRVAGELADGLGKSFVEVPSGGAIEGRLVRQVDLASGRLALVEKSREFTLVPWRAVLEKRIGQQVSGIMRNDGINWRFGRDRGPEIS